MKENKFQEISVKEFVCYSLKSTKQDNVAVKLYDHIPEILCSNFDRILHDFTQYVQANAVLVS
jgi:hypothetical protein